MTTAGIVMAGRTCGRFIAKEDGIVCGLEVAKRVFHHVERLCGEDAPIVMRLQVPEGRGPSGDVLAGSEPRPPDPVEGRVALQHTSAPVGIATDRSCRDGRKDALRASLYPQDTPGLRVLEKYAVRFQGRHNHQLNLSDGVLIKDNLSSRRAESPPRSPPTVPTPPHLRIEVESETLEQVDEALAAGLDILLLDNIDNAHGRGGRAGREPRAYRSVGKHG